MFRINVQNENQNKEESRVNSFDSARVEVDVREPLLLGLFDDDLRDKVPWYDEEYIDTYESSNHEFREGMEDDDCGDGDSS